MATALAVAVAVAAINQFLNQPKEGKMQITIAQAQNIISSPIFGLKLPMAISFQIARLGKGIQAELKTYDEELGKLIKSCNGTQAEDKPGFFVFGPDTATAFQIGMLDLLEATFDVGSAWPMDLGKLGSIELSATELMNLDPLFTVSE